MTPLSSIIAAATYSSREPCPNELGESGGLVRGAFCCVAELFREPCPVVSRALSRGIKGAARRNLVLGIFLLLLVDDALHLLLRLRLRRGLYTRATALRCRTVSGALPRGLKGAARRNLVLGIFLLLLVDDALHLLLRLHLRRELSSRATALLLGCSGNTQCGRCCYNDDLFHEFLLQNLRIRFVNASKNRLVARSASRSSKIEIEAPIRFAIDLMQSGHACPHGIE